MQLPDLHIRGALGTQTMPNLSDSEISLADDLTKKIIKEPSLQPDKYEFTKQLRNTIRGDYADMDAALQEFTIAVWRGVIHLLYHRSYSYKCTLCDKKEYYTKTNKLKAFDQQYPVCRGCQQTITEDGTIGKVEKRGNKYYVEDIDTGEVIYKARLKRDIEPKCKSPLVPVPGEKKIDNPWEILNDSTQLNKWFSVFIWNYFKQILNENSIIKKKEKVNISGPAAYIAFLEIRNELRKSKEKFYTDPKYIYSVDNFIINLTHLQCVPRITRFIHETKARYSEHNVKFSITDSTIKINADGYQKLMNTTITTNDPIIAVSLSGKPRKNGNDDQGSWADALQYNTRDYDQLCDTGSVEIKDQIQVLKTRLQPKARPIVDILCQWGKHWEDFCNQYERTSDENIREYCGITSEEHKRFTSMIRAACLDTMDV